MLEMNYDHAGHALQRPIPNDSFERVVHFQANAQPMPRRVVVLARHMNESMRPTKRFSLVECVAVLVGPAGATNLLLKQAGWPPMPFGVFMCIALAAPIYEFVLGPVVRIALGVRLPSLSELGSRTWEGRDGKAWREWIVDEQWCPACAYSLQGLPPTRVVEPAEGLGRIVRRPMASFVQCPECCAAWAPSSRLSELGVASGSS
jgi:hypothetical protein